MSVQVYSAGGVAAEAAGGVAAEAAEIGGPGTAAHAVSKEQATIVISGFMIIGPPWPAGRLCSDLRRSSEQPLPGIRQPQGRRPDLQRGARPMRAEQRQVFMLRVFDVDTIC